MFNLHTNSRSAPPPGRQRAKTSLLFAMILCATFSNGCKTSAHSSDARLRGIDEMLDAELPKGSNLARVNLFLNERGYKVENPGSGQTVVAVVRKIDTETLRPANARVTFHFDKQDQLQSYEMAAAPDQPLHP